MNKNKTTYLVGLIGIILFLGSSLKALGQTQPGAPLGLPGEKKDDSIAFNKSNTDDWHNEQIRVSYRYAHSNKSYNVDTSLHTFHRKPYSQPWYQDLGNLGMATRNLKFTPENRLGPTLGYNVFDAYRFNKDSLRYYNTSSPYSEFVYNLGSKLEQRVSVLHTQNIKPNWNVAAHYNKITSEGYFLLQRTNHDNIAVSTNYQSINRRYILHANVIYNKSLQDENGGLSDITQLEQDDFNDRSTVDINYNNAVSPSSGAVRRSLVTNNLRDYSVNLSHSYSWGSTDTLYNKDSTSMKLNYTKRFSVSHEFSLTNRQYTFKDLRPDSTRYASFFTQSFVGDGSDSVFTQQRQNTIDNRLLLNGYIGKGAKQLSFSAGAGIQLDRFTTWFLVDRNKLNVASNYVIGRLFKESVDTGQWHYNANLKFYTTGVAAGNSQLNASIGKDINKAFDLSAGLQQNINNAPYSYTTYYNQYDTITNTFNKETVTAVYGRISSNKYKFNIEAKNYLINNYIYLNSAQLATQYTSTFNILQLSARKILKWKSVVLDNEIIFQQVSNNAPVNIPQVMGRHQLSLERYIFRGALKVATGAEVRYQSSYNTASYSPIFNRFYYTNANMLSNTPQGSIFFNFKIKRFRAYIMVDQVQQFFVTNMVVAPGYAASNAMLRFGFNWTLIK